MKVQPEANDILENCKIQEDDQLSIDKRIDTNLKIKEKTPENAAVSFDQNVTKIELMNDEDLNLPSPGVQLPPLPGVDAPTTNNVSYDTTSV